MLCEKRKIHDFGKTQKKILMEDLGKKNRAFQSHNKITLIVQSKNGDSFQKIHLTYLEQVSSVLQVSTISIQIYWNFLR